MNVKVKISERAGASFPVRRMNFDFDHVPDYWMHGSAGLTHFMTALSALFPAGEKFFIDSVRAVRQHPAIKDNAELHNEIPACVGHRARRGHERVGFSACAQRYGHGVDTLDHCTDQLIQPARKVMEKHLKPVGISPEMVDLSATTA